MANITETPAWLALQQSAQQPRRIEQLFRDDKNRFDHCSLTLDDLLFDFSKTSLQPSDINHLLELARTAAIEQARELLFGGHIVNHSEEQAALHPALRCQRATNDEERRIIGQREAMLDFAAGCRRGEIRGYHDEPFTDVVNIGIGGSESGCALGIDALASFHDGPRVHFISHTEDVQSVLRALYPARTLIIVSSKSFSTAETLRNAEQAQQWLVRELPADAIAQHWVAITADAPRAKSMGAKRIFHYPRGVGGRYSVYSPVGLPLAIAIGEKNFQDFLAGAHALDTHFTEQPLEKNIPVMLALVDIWHRNFCRYPTLAIIPYSRRLQLLPAYMQQLMMESNGKRVTQDGNAITAATCPVVWGAIGTNAQHSFFQLLHQGSDIVPTEFLAACHPERDGDDAQQQQLLANCFAQSQTLMSGGGDDDGAHHCPGNRPSITLLYRRIDPYTLGRLLALYEHRVFVAGALWGINSFDQWGVELGKNVARDLEDHLTDSGDRDSTSPATGGLLDHYRKLSNASNEK